MGQQILETSLLGHFLDCSKYVGVVLVGDT
jgi:hypothetical protein